MIEKLLGLSDKSIVKKSNYYAHIFGAIMGLVAILSGAGTMLFKFSDTYKGVWLYQNENIEYLKLLSQEIKDPKLLNISEFYALNSDTLIEMYQGFAGLLIVGGIVLISNFILFRKLRNKLISENLQKDKVNHNE